MACNPVFNFNINQKILPGLVALGDFGNGSPCLAVVTAFNKIHINDLLTCGNRRVSDENTLSLNFSQPIVCISAVRFKDDEYDLLLICSKNRVYLYNVYLNQDVFVQEVVDGGNTAIYGLIGVKESVLVGGNCSVQGYDKNGTDLYWIVTGDNVRSLALVDIDNDGEDELIVGSDDYDIRIFKKEDLVHEITETQIVTHLLNFGM